MTKRGVTDRYPGVTQIEGGYVVRVTHLVNGKQKEVQRKLLGVSLSEAVVKREELRTELLNGKPEAETVRQFSARWLSHLETVGRIRPHVAVKRRYNLDRWILPILGGIPIQEVKRVDISRWMEWMSGQRKENGELYSQDTCFNAWHCLKQLFNDAAYLADLKTNPCAGMRLHTPMKEPKGKASLTREELDRFLAETVHERPDQALLLWLLATTGLRFSEASALTWADIDLERQTIEVRKAQVDNVLGLTKTKRARTVPLHPVIKGRLEGYKAWQLSQSRPNPLNLLFPNREGRYKEVSSMTKPMQACARRAGLDKRVSTHVFRHTINNLLRKEAGSIVAMAMLGHTTDKMHVRYSHVDQTELSQSQLNALGLDPDQEATDER